MCVFGVLLSYFIPLLDVTLFSLFFFLSLFHSFFFSLVAVEAKEQNPLRMGFYGARAFFLFFFFDMAAANSS